MALEYAEKALQYCEYPQLWYYWPLSEYYKLQKDYKNALKYRLKSIHREIESDYVFIATCNWLLGNKELAFATYGDLILKFPDFHIIKFRENRHIHDVNGLRGLNWLSMSLFQNKHILILRPSIIHSFLSVNSARIYLMGKSRHKATYLVRLTHFEGIHEEVFNDV